MSKLKSRGNYIFGRCNQKCNELAFDSHVDIAGAIWFVFAFSTWRLIADYATPDSPTDRVFTNKRIIPPDPPPDPPPLELYKSYGLLAVPYPELPPLAVCDPLTKRLDIGCSNEPITANNILEYFHR
ncbi:hypothetical protein Tco_0431174 [Tanacetum coccineum]